MPPVEAPEKPTSDASPPAEKPTPEASPPAESPPTSEPEPRSGGDEASRDRRRVAHDRDARRNGRAVEESLLRRYAVSRDPAVRDQLVERLMPLARSLALRYRGTSESIEDLCQVAYLGLVKAVDGFDPRRGRSFTTYAVPTILGELRRHFRDRVWNLRLPRSLQERTATVDDAMAKLGDELGRAPTVNEVAEHAELDVEEVLEAMAAGEARRTLSLDMPRTHEEESDPVIETIGASDTSYDAVEAQIAAPEAKLDERELLVLRLRFGANETQYEIGTRLGVSQMQVSRIMRGALRKLLSAVRGETESATGAPPAGST
jgi:RNA polymerase sigma-B factor